MAWLDETTHYPWLLGPDRRKASLIHAARKKERETSAKLFPIGSTNEVLLAYSVEPRDLAPYYRNVKLPPPTDTNPKS